MLLKDIADPNTIDCLYKATESKFDYLDYDDTYQLARKCIKALSSIGTENAFKKIKLLMIVVSQKYPNMRKRNFVIEDYYNL